MTSDGKRNRQLAAVTAAVALGLALWFVRSQRVDGISVPASNYFTGPMRTPAHPNTYVDARGDIYDKGPDGRFIKREAASASLAGAPGRANLGGSTGVGQASPAR